MMSFVETKLSGTEPSIAGTFSFQRAGSAHGALPPCDSERSKRP